MDALFKSLDSLERDRLRTKGYVMAQLMLPRDAIDRDPPNVWLTSFYGFDPANWGFLGFSIDAQRNGFLKHTEAGVLVVIYAAGKAKKDILGHVVGVLQCSHRVNTAQAFMSPVAYEIKQKDPDRTGRWDLGVKAVRAWRVAPDGRPRIEEFADTTYRPARAQVIGSQGMRLASHEAKRLLAMDLQEVEVFGEQPIVASAVGIGAEIFLPNRPGPVSQSPYVVREAEGPKSLYILQLNGDLNAFLGQSVEDNMMVVKVGMSKSPATRCLDYNNALPRCAFAWSIFKDNRDDNLDLFPSSKAAIAGENVMKKVLAAQGVSLDGEFFLAKKSSVLEAWNAGVKAGYK